MSRTMVITVIDGDHVASTVNQALAAAGLAPTETTCFDMDDARGGIEQNSRPDDVCRSCGFIDGGCGDGYDDNGHCTSCQDAMGNFVPEGDSCASCGAPHGGQAARDVFTDQQLLEAVEFCPDCHWPQFEWKDGAHDARRAGEKGEAL